MSWRAHYERGELGPAIEQLRERTRRGPSSEAQLLLALLLGTAGRWEDAVVSLQRACSIDPGCERAARELERCLSADQLRREPRFSPARGDRAILGGALPSFLALRAQAAALHDAGDWRGARGGLERAAEATPPQGGSLVTRRGTRVPFEDISDIDDLTGPRFEVIAGTLLEVPFSRARRLVFGARRGLLDELFLPVVIDPADGPRIEGRLPLLYAGTSAQPASPASVGRESRVSTDTGYQVAWGRREFRLRAEGGAGAAVGADSVAQIELDALAADEPSERTTWRPPAPAL